MLAQCDRFHCLPDQLLAQSTRLIRLLKIEELGGGDPDAEYH